MRPHSPREGEKPVAGYRDGGDSGALPTSTARPRWICAGVGRVQGCRVSFEKCPYASINRFYISHALSPIGAFFKDTPAYVVAAFDDDVTIASHPAPQHLIAHLAARPNVTILDADSTHQAAALVAEGKARACLTTRIAADLVGLKTLDVVIQTIPMLWTVFASKEH